MLKPTEDQEKFRSSFNAMKAEQRNQERLNAERTRALIVQMLDSQFQSDFEQLMKNGEQKVKGAISMSSLADCDDEMEGYVSMAIVQEAITAFEAIKESL